MQIRMHITNTFKYEMTVYYRNLLTILSYVYYKMHMIGI